MSMRLSALQRFILRECYGRARAHIPRSVFQSFYRRSATKETTDSLTRSLERLIDKGLLIGYGRRTPKKWFIQEVQLTPLGRATARRALGQQQRLTFH